MSESSRIVLFFSYYCKMEPIKYIAENHRDALWGLSVCSVGYQKIEPGEAYPPTGHHKEYVFEPERGRVLQEYQLLYIVSGEGTLSTRHGGTQRIHRGDMFLLFPGEWHSYHPLEETGWEEYWIGFQGTNIDHRVEAGFFSTDSPVYHIGVNETISELYRDAIQTATRQEAFFQQLLAGIVNHLLGLMFMVSHNRQLSSTSQIPDFVERARSYMQQVIEENVSMPEIACHLGMSYATFRHTFKKYTGLSPAQYFINLRLHRAKELLRSTSIPIKEISYRLHFENPEYFATLFKKRTGLRPSTFRK